jgi:replicative DNA helicase
VAERLAVVEDSSQLTVAQVRAQARRAMQQHQTERCLVLVDYLQLWAKVAEDLRGNFSVRERVDMLGGLLRELALSLHSPVLALAIMAMAKVAPRWIRSKKAVTWSTRRMWCCF